MSTACSSTPVIGAGSFFPGGRFAAPRSYFKSWTIQQTIWLTSRVDNVITMTNPLVFWDTLQVVIDQRFYEWNSNAWTLDHVICECCFINLLTSVKTAEPYSLFYTKTVGHDWPRLVFHPSGFDLALGLEFDMPPGNPLYWLPDPD